MAKTKSTGRTPAARPARKVATGASDKTLKGQRVAASSTRSRQNTGQTVVAAPTLKLRGATTTARPPLGVMPGMRALSKTTTVMSAPPPAPKPIVVPVRDELAAPRDVARLLRYGERFGDHRIDIRMLPLPLPASSGAIAIADPTAPKSWRVFDRPIPAGQFRVMLSVAKLGDSERVAAIVIHVGRPPIAKWTVAHYRGQKKPKSADALPRVPVTSGWLVLADGGAPTGALATPVGHVGLGPFELAAGVLAFPCIDGDHAAYWAVDAADKPVCLVIELEIFKAKDWKVPRA